MELAARNGGVGRQEEYTGFLLRHSEDCRAWQGVQAGANWWGNRQSGRDWRVEFIYYRWMIFSCAGESAGEGSQAQTNTNKQRHKQDNGGRRRRLHPEKTVQFISALNPFI